MTTTNNIKTLSSCDTDYSADSVEWCPHEPHQNIFVCGTYQLSKDETQNSIMQNDLPHKRLGKMLLYELVDRNDLKLLETKMTSAILDQKWCHNLIKEKSFLAVVNADGFLQIFELIFEPNYGLKLIVEICVNIEFQDNLALSLDWCTGKYESDCPKIVVSDSKGFVTVWNFGGESLEQLHRFHVHDFEAWIAAFDYWDSNIIYTGGDDCKFKTFDLRCGTSVNTSSCHNAGVTSIQSNKLCEHQLATGSYDENLLLWDTRQRKYPISTTNLGGGVWRVKWDPFTCKNILAASMYNGFHIVSCEDMENPNVIAEYHDHESIAYGADWSYLNIKSDLEEACESNVRILATCSFYDHKLSVFKLSLS